ncbi:glycosyltransferase family 2 protein [Shouchella clausii]|uniref:glycosyltransferase family 2 protein n=1 Tax=Shouchella clausii TaxID=79880 RepID=UPI0007C5A92F|nr:glycosyltransferase family 2 protein [Shouchella clausii]
MSRPKVSVVIPTYNRANVLNRAVNSVLNQTYDNIELIVVDDASTDDTKSLLESITDKRFKYIKLDKNSKGKLPRNIGIKNSTGKYIAFLDSDDEWLPEKLELQIKKICEIDNENFICFTDLILNNGKKLLAKKQITYNNSTDIMEYILVQNNIVQTSTYLLPTSLAKRIMFNEELSKHQDWDFCLRLREMGALFIHLNEKLTVWHVDPREDRKSNNKDYKASLNWFEANLSLFTERTKYAFIVKYLLEFYQQKYGKIYTIKILLKSYFNGSIKSVIFLRKIVKISLPVLLRRKNGK